METKDINYTKIPHKIFELNLDAYEIALFCALKMHGKQIFPGSARLRSMIGGVSRDKFWKSLTTLRKCNIVQWEMNLGTSNRYFILGEGNWSVKRTTTRTPGRLLPVRQADTNKTNKQDLTTRGEGFLLIVDKLKAKAGKRG